MANNSPEVIPRTDSYRKVKGSSAHVVKRENRMKILNPRELHGLLISWTDNHFIITLDAKDSE